MNAMRLGATAAVAVLASLAYPRAGAGQGVQIPLERGLTLSYVTSLKGEPDFENIVMIESADSDEVRLRISWNRGDRRWKFFRRPLSRRERLRARSFYTYAQANDRNERRGYAYSMATGVVLDALKREGRADVALLVPNLAPLAPYRGTLNRVGGSEPFSVLMDGQRVSLRAIRASGTLENPAAGERRIRAEFLFLDDPEAPWYLDERLESTHGNSGHTLLVRVASSKAAKQLEATLRSRCEAHVSDIFFATGSAEIDSASAPTFRRIAEVLAANPAWQVGLVGHTDDIGDDAANLELSRRRAEAARTVLVRDYRIPANRLTAEGRGEREPLENDATPQGRARNRRVDLKRKC